MKIVFVAAAAAVLAVGGVASAQMAAGSKSDAMATKMSPADTKKIEHCKAMSHDAMAKNATCAKMMKLHPAAFDYSPMVN